MRRAVTTTHLELTAPEQHRPARPAAVDWRLVRAELPSPELSRYLYTAVGWRWGWYARLGWDRARWLAWLDRPELETWLAWVAGTPAGYFELEAQRADSVEIAYFGVLPDFVGRGLGGALLSAAIERAWARGAARVWVHTCTLDHPSALPNYRARGFRVFDVQEADEELPDAPLEPWAGANAGGDPGS